MTTPTSEMSALRRPNAIEMVASDDTASYISVTSYDIYNEKGNMVVVIRKAASVQVRHVMDHVLLFVWLGKFSHPFLANSCGTSNNAPICSWRSTFLFL